MISVFSPHTEHYTSLHKLMDEYIHYVIELLQAQAIEVQYNEVLKIPRSESRTLCKLHYLRILLELSYTATGIPLTRL